MAGKATSARGQVDSLYGQFLEAHNHNQTIANQAVALGTVTGTTGKATGAKGQIDSLYGQFLENENEINRNANQTVNLGLSDSSVSHGSSVGGAVVPATTETEPTETEPTETGGGGAPKYDTSSGPRGPLSYSSYLTSAGADVQSAYNEAVAAVRREYAFNRATFGAKGEQLARAGLTGSGYGDYLEGKAYAAMASTVGQAERAKADSYANYLASYGAQAGSYSSYLSSEVDDFVNTTLTPLISQALLENREISDEDLIAVAKQEGYDITSEHIQLARNNALVNNRVSGADAAVIDNAVYGAVYDVDGNMREMQDEQYYRNVAATRFGLKEEQMESYLQKIQQRYGKTFEENAADKAAQEAATEAENYINATLIPLISQRMVEGKAISDGEILAEAKQAGYDITAEQIQSAREIASAMADQEINARDVIIDSMVATAIETAGEGGIVTRETLEEIANMNNVDVDEQMMAKIEDRLKDVGVRVKTNAQVIKESAIATVNAVSNVSELVNTYSSDAVARFISEGGDETEINARREAASGKMAEILLSAYNLEEGDMLGIAKLIYGENATVDMLGDNQHDAGGPIMRAAKDAYDKGAMAYEDIKLVTDKVVEETLKNADDPDELVQLANTLTILKGDGDFTSLYQGYMDRVAEKIKIPKQIIPLIHDDEKSTAQLAINYNIVGGTKETAHFLLGEEVVLLTEQEKTQGSFLAVKKGKLFIRQGDYWNELLVYGGDETDTVISALIVRKLSGAYDEQISQIINDAKNSYTPQSITDSVSKPKSSYAGYLTGQS